VAACEPVLAGSDDLIASRGCAGLPAMPFAPVSPRRLFAPVSPRRLFAPVSPRCLFAPAQISIRFGRSVWGLGSRSVSAPSAGVVSIARATGRPGRAHGQPIA